LIANYLRHNFEIDFGYWNAFYSMRHWYVQYPNWQTPLFLAILAIDPASREKHAKVAKDRIFERLLQSTLESDDVEIRAIIDSVPLLPREVTAMNPKARG